ncbi:L,D-transpeptidase [Bifidobacterium choloepi]|uniref:L,D-transpeptidase family protein n=1 Tax=Bifidobacterium choloepi TaxID=2614131 RepID=A0A6I5NK67_9BIFI|nr:L,D-transpeptidase [Bifidobacterium choloepi]NEG69252.1 L,D-transpeptidase family protein [Bifidobacterium choloepi]
MTDGSFDNDGQWKDDSSGDDGRVTLDDFDAANELAGAGASAPAAKKRHVWPWIVGGAIVVLAAAAGCTAWFFQSHTLPGVSLWGTSMTGKSTQQIADEINETVADTKVPVSYDGKTVDVTLSDLGITVDADSIADQAEQAKRDLAWWEWYSPWTTVDVTPTIDLSGIDATKLNNDFGVSGATAAVNASLQLDDDGNIEVVDAVTGTGIDPTPVANEAVAVVESFGTKQASTVTGTETTIEPAVTDDIANAAKTKLDGLVDNPVEIDVDGNSIGTFTAEALLDATTIDPSATQETASDGDYVVDNLVIDSAKLQDWYDKNIKANLSATASEQDEIVNNDGDVLQVTTKGHDGVTIDDGADDNVGVDAAKAIVDGTTKVSVDGTFTAMKVNKTVRHMVADLSDHTLTLYENGKAIKVVHFLCGMGNDFKTGECTGDFCTPTGDFKIWLKYDSQNMTGTLTTSTGETESWDAPNVGYVNYFSKSGCAIHRIATSEPWSDAQIAAYTKNTSHGCMGIGWDVAEEVYDFAIMGVTLHVQQ